ncbi:hypothetical protein D3C73_427860 [compost metagenome]
MADDTGIRHQPLDIGLTEFRHLVKIEAGKARAKILALAQDRQPGKAGLKPFEADLFKQADIVGDRAAPFLVVVTAVILQPAMPEAASPAILAGYDARHFLLPDHAIRSNSFYAIPIVNGSIAGFSFRQPCLETGG